MFSRTESLAPSESCRVGWSADDQTENFIGTSSTFTSVQLEAVRYYDYDGNRKVKRKTITTRFGKQNYNSARHQVQNELN